MADAAVMVWADRDPDVRRVLALVARKGIPVHVIGALEKKPRAVWNREAEPPRREGMLPAGGQGTSRVRGDGGLHSRHQQRAT